MNLIPYDTYVIDHQSLINEVMRITNGEEIVGQQAFYSTDLGKVTHRRIIRTLIDKFKAERTHENSGNDERRALEFKQENLSKKGREYNVSENIEILAGEPSQQDASLPDSFDTLFVVDSSSGGTKGMQIRYKHQDNAITTSIISKEQWAKYANIFQYITENNTDNNKNNVDRNLEKPMPTS
jgi:hypothetical protein